MQQIKTKIPTIKQQPLLNNFISMIQLHFVLIVRLFNLISLTFEHWMATTLNKNQNKKKTNNLSVWNATDK